MSIKKLYQGTDVYVVSDMHICIVHNVQDCDVTLYRNTVSAVLTLPNKGDRKGLERAVIKDHELVMALREMKVIG